MHKAIRINYDTFIYGDPAETEKLTPIDKAEHSAIERNAHIIALFFLLSRIDLRFENLDEFDTNIQLRRVGDLGVGISEGIFGDVDHLVEIANISAQGCKENKNESTIS